ncbi:MAG: GTP cyclohydrolase II RibA [Acidimicrobiales bacterium]
MAPDLFDHASSPLKSVFGSAVLHCFSFGEHEEDNVLVIDCLDRSGQDWPPVRVQSACYTAEIFRSTDCDCHGQLAASLRRVHAEGGLLVYMIADGRGAGLLTKVRGLSLGATEGLDTYDAYERLGVDSDPRDYSRVVEVLRYLCVTRLTLLTNNPRKVAGLESGGIAVQQEAILIEPTEDSLPYLLTKQEKMGHELGLSDH